MIRILQITAMAAIMTATAFEARAAINIAIIVPADKAGNQLAEGAFTAVKEINGEGGIKGKRVNLMRVEDPCDDILSLTTAEMISLNRLPEQQVDLVIGPYCPNRGQEIADLYRKKKILQILPIPVSSEIHRKGNSLPLKFLGYSEQQASAVFDFYRRHYEGAPFAFVYDNRDAEMTGTAKALLQKFEESGRADKLLTFSYENYRKNLNKMAKNIIKGKAAAVYITGKPEQVAEVANLIRNKSLALPLITNQFQTPENFVPQMGNYAENTYLLKISSLKDNPYFAETLVKLRLAGTEPEGLMPYGYLAVRFAEKLWQKNGGTQFAKAAAALKNCPMDAGWGNGGFKDGIPNKSVDYIFEKSVQGEYTQAN